MNCLCGGEYKEVAFNCDLADGSELYEVYGESGILRTV